MPDLTPAPGCTATSAPSPIIFLTVSGVAATRGSDGSDSAATAIFIMPPTAARCPRGCSRSPLGREPNRLRQKIGHPDQDDDDKSHDPFHERQKAQIGLLMGGVVIALRYRIFGGAVRGHHAILSVPFQSRPGFRIVRQPQLRFGT